MAITLKFADIPKSGLPSEGSWDAVVKQAFLKPNSAKDSHNVEVMFEFVGSEYAGKTIRRWFSLKPTVQGLAYQLFVNLGAIKDGDDLDLVEDPKTLVLVKPNIINKPCILVMGEQEDSDFSQVEDVLPPKNASTGRTEVLEKARPSLR